MENKRGILSRFDRFQKFLLISTLIFAVCLFLIICIYWLFGRSVIEKAYNGQSFNFINNFIQHQYKYPLEHYLTLGPQLLQRLLLLSIVLYICVAGFSFFIYRLLFFEQIQRINLVIAILLPLLAVITVYYINPSFRIYSNHGYYRGGIVYQIMNGYIPPLDPLFDGYTVHSPWGFLWLIAMISEIFRISPFYSFAICNLACLIFTTIGVYMIAGLVCKNQKARILSTLIAIYAVTPLPDKLSAFLQNLFHNQAVEIRATPIFRKYMTINGNPIGIVFFVLFVYSMIRLLRDGRYARYTPLLLASFLGAGFFYAPVFPAMVVCLAVFIFLSLFPFFKKFNPSWISTVSMCFVFLVGCVIIYPYFATISSGVSSDVQVLNPVFMYRNAVNFLVSLLPILLIISLVGKKVLSSMEIRAGLILVIILLSSTLCFLCIHILDGAEYKFFGLASICVGILGGIAFENIAGRNKLTALVLVVIFTIPFVDLCLRRAFKHSEPIQLAVSEMDIYEKGVQLFVKDPSENELYRWIQGNTSTDQLFIDTNLDLPIFARRRLLVGLGDIVYTGYGIDMKTIAMRNGYDKNEYELRKRVVRNIYGFEQTMDRDEILSLLKEKQIMVVVRKESLSTNFNRQGLHEVFRSSDGTYLVYTVQNDSLTSVDLPCSAGGSFCFFP